MTITEDGYEPDSEDEIFERLKEEFESQFNTTVVPGTVINGLLRSEAAVLAKHQEQALSKVYHSAYLADAEGEELGKLVETIGLERRESVPATGVVTVGRESPPSDTHIVAGGTSLQTRGTDPVHFDTQDSAALRFIEGFEDGTVDAWKGDTPDVTVQDTTALADQFSVELPAMAGVSIYRDDFNYKIGDTYEQYIQLGANSTYAFRFGRQDISNYYEVEVDADLSEFGLNIVDDGTEAETSFTSLTVPTDTRLYLEVQWNITGDIIATLWETEEKNTEVERITITDPSMRFLSGGVALVSKDANSPKYVDNLVTREIAVDIESTDPGITSNVAPNTITVFESRPSGVEYVSNTLPTGDVTYTDTHGRFFVQGRDREDDEQLRDRAYESTAIGGSATVNAIGTELTRLDSVNSVKIFQNKTNVDNTDSGGLPAKSFEIALHGGQEKEVAQAIFDAKSVDSHDYGGAHGTLKSYTVSSEILNDSEEINWTEIPEINLDITLDLVVDETYVGHEEIQSRIATYIGGTGVDGAAVQGLGVGADMYVGVLKDVVIGPSDTGVYDVASYTIDRNGDGTDDTETNANGATVLSITDAEVAVTNARDGSIEITTSSI